MTADKFWELTAPLENHPAVRRSTMMGLPCLRHDGQFFASFDHRTHTLVIKLDRRRVAELIDDGTGQPFAPAGRVFREWIAIPHTHHWPALLEEAHAFAAGTAKTAVAATDDVEFTGSGKAGAANHPDIDREHGCAARTNPSCT